MLIETNKIYNVDCLDGMSNLNDKSVDLIIIDPPYNIGKDDWDKIENYEDWMFSVFRECQRVLKPTGSMYWFHNDFEVVSDFQQFLKKETDFIFRNILIWNKKFEGCYSEAYMNIAIGTNKNRTYRKFAEYCLFYTFKDVTDLDYSHLEKDIYFPFREYIGSSLRKSKTSWKDLRIINALLDNGIGKSFGVARQISQNKLNSDYVQMKMMSEKEYKIIDPIVKFDKTYEELSAWWKELNTEFRKKRKEYKSETKEVLNNSRYVFNKQKNHSVINYQTPKEKVHLTQKPIDMIIDLINTSSNEGDIVLDCFMGSGTTAVACKKTNRKYIGFEKEKKYVEIANKELSKTPSA